MTSNVDVVLEAIRAVEERDRETLFGLYHDEVEFHDAPSLPYGGSSRGREALREQLETAPEETWLGTWGPLQPTEHERRMDARVVAADDEEVVVLYRAASLGSERRAARCPRARSVRGPRWQVRAGGDVPLRHGGDRRLPGAGETLVGLRASRAGAVTSRYPASTEVADRRCPCRASHAPLCRSSRRRSRASCRRSWSGASAINESPRWTAGSR